MSCTVTPGYQQSILYTFTVVLLLGWRWPSFYDYNMQSAKTVLLLYKLVSILNQGDWIEALILVEAVSCVLPVMNNQTRIWV